jgi:predicted glycoside hydrolase/deacetylase ChbG (UPF0249 family)
MKLLLRADDLGYSEGCNCGIIKSVKDGLIQTVGLMTNMPHAQVGYEAIKDDNVCLGLHTNITAHKPLSDPALIPSIVTKEGNFKPSREYRNATEEFVVLDEVILEIEAQLQEYKRITNKNPDYIEGHAIANPVFLKGLEIVADKYGLKFSGFPDKDTPFFIQGKEFDVSMESMLQDYDPYQSLEDFIANSDAEYGMFVTHPGYLDQYILDTSSLTRPRPKEVEMLCNPKTKDLLEKYNVTLITYFDL